MLQRKVIIELNIPEGATHYLGNPPGEMEFFKKVYINEITHWFSYDNRRDGWYLDCHGKGWGFKELQFVE